MHVQAGLSVVFCRRVFLWLEFSRRMFQDDDPSLPQGKLMCHFCHPVATSIVSDGTVRPPSVESP